jgi:hypothetical protein
MQVKLTITNYSVYEFKHQTQIILQTCFALLHST